MSQYQTNKRIKRRAERRVKRKATLKTIVGALLLLALAFCLTNYSHRQVLKAEYNQCQEWLKQSRNFYGHYWTENQKEQCSKVAGFEFNE